MMHFHSSACSGSRNNAANCSTVSCFRIVTSCNFVENSAAMRENTRTAASELPPTSLKRSVTPMSRAPMTCFQIANTRSSTSSLGAMRTRGPDDASGAGNALRSSFPDGDSGITSSCTYDHGTMYDGNDSSSRARNSVADTFASPTATKYATSRASIPASLRSTTRALAHTRIARQRLLDLTDLDAKTTQLDLEVETAQVLDGSVSQPARTITGAIHPRCRARRERIGYVSLGGQLIATVVARTDLHAADEQLTRHTDRHGLHRSVEYVDARVGDRLADGNDLPRVAAAAQLIRRLHARIRSGRRGCTSARRAVA